jgi:hypothetical protein
MEVVMSEDRSQIAASSLLKELLKKPGFKDDVRDILNSIDPQAGRELIKAFMWQDIEFSMGLMGGLPAIANTLIRAADELLLQVNGKFSIELLQGFTDSLLNEIDKGSLIRALRNARPIIDALSPLFRKAWQETKAEEGGELS